MHDDDNGVVVSKKGLAVVEVVVDVGSSYSSSVLNVPLLKKDSVSLRSWSIAKHDDASLSLDGGGSIVIGGARGGDVCMEGCFCWCCCCCTRGRIGALAGRGGFDGLG